MRVLGWLVAVLWVLGSLNVLDFHVCIKGPGECGKHQKESK